MVNGMSVNVIVDKNDQGTSREKGRDEMNIPFHCDFVLGTWEQQRE